MARLLYTDRAIPYFVRKQHEVMMTPFTMSVFSIGAPDKAAPPPPPQSADTGEHPPFEEVLNRTIDPEETAVGRARAGAEADAKAKAALAEQRAERYSDDRPVNTRSIEDRSGRPEAKRRASSVQDETPPGSVAAVNENTGNPTHTATPGLGAQQGQAVAEEGLWADKGGGGQRSPVQGAGLPGGQAEAGLPVAGAGRKSAAGPTVKGETDPFSMAMRHASQKGKAAPRPTQGPQSPLRAHAPTFGQDLAERVGRMRVIARNGQSEQVRITLEPRELGTLDVRLQVDEGSRVHLLITAESEAAKEVISRQMAQLREALARQNLEFGEVTVQVDDGQWQNGAQWRAGQDDGRQQQRAFREEAAVEPPAQGRPKAAISAGDGGLSVVV